MTLESEGLLERHQIRTVKRLSPPLAVGDRPGEPPPLDCHSPPRTFNGSGEGGRYNDLGQYHPPNREPLVVGDRCRALQKPEPRRRCRLPLPRVPVFLRRPLIAWGGVHWLAEAVDRPSRSRATSLSHRCARSGRPSPATACESRRSLPLGRLVVGTDRLPRPM